MTDIEGKCLCVCELVRDVFAAGVEAMKLQMNHDARDNFRNTKRTFESAKNTAENQMLTIVVNTADEEQRRFLPGQTVSLSIAEMLSFGAYSMDDDARDGLNYATSADVNLIESAMIRITGADVRIGINYYNERDHNFEHLYPSDYTPGSGYHEVNVLCVIKVEVMNTWQSRQTKDNYDRYRAALRFSAGCDIRVVRRAERRKDSPKAPSER